MSCRGAIRPGALGATQIHILVTNHEERRTRGAAGQVKTLAHEVIAVAIASPKIGSVFVTVTLWFNRLYRAPNAWRGQNQAG